MGQGALDMMSKITPLTAEQRGTLARLVSLVARRHGLPDSSKAADISLLDHVATLRRAFPLGLVDPAWQGRQRAARAREGLVPRARELLSLESLDAQLKAQKFGELWADAAQVLGATGWLPQDRLKPAPALGLGLLAGAVRELLYGSATIEQRVDRFSVAFETAFRRPPHWETTTGLLALVSPDGHVLVDLAAFRKLVKLVGSKGTLSNGPNGAGYVRCLKAARIVASKLTELGEAPRDLLDVHDFVGFALRASSPVRKPKAAKAPKKRIRSAEAGDDSEPSD